MEEKVIIFLLRVTFISSVVCMYEFFLQHLSRNTKSSSPDCRPPVPNRPSALQSAVMRFAEHKSEQVMNIQIGTEFDNLDEGYDYYNVYSWEIGFGIRWGRKRWSAKQRGKNMADMKPYQLGQELYCSCRVRAVFMLIVLVHSYFVDL